MIEIKSRFTGATLLAVNAETLSGANLSRADLSDANLSRADLYGADLSSANLSRADLSDANLSRADLSSANLSRADLSDANLSRADLYGADLSSANLSRAILPTGETLEVYCTEVLPALLTAGGKTVAEIVAAGAWNCHAWRDGSLSCPMGVAFGCDSLEGVPILLRPRAFQFIQLFDARILPCPDPQS